MNISELEKTINSGYNNITGIVVLKNGEAVCESYFHDCAAADAVHIFSVTKSVLSALIGIAIDEGHIKDIEQKVLDFFPGYTMKQGERTLQRVTIKNLLTMTAPYKFKSEPYEGFFASDSWVTAALDSLGGDDPIGTFRYAPIIGPDILSGILVKTTGQSVLDFARKHLFSPLGINVPRNIVFHDQQEQFAFYKAKNVSGWVADPQGVNTAAWGLCLSPMDMAKIGQLYLNGGTWEGKQIVPAGWIEASTKEHSRWEEHNLSYGYLWWVIDDDSYAAMGDGGNVIYVNTKKNLVVAIASLFMPDASDRLELIKGYIEPML